MHILFTYLFAKIIKRFNDTLHVLGTINLSDSEIKKPALSPRYSQKMHKTY